MTCNSRRLMGVKGPMLINVTMNKHENCWIVLSNIKNKSDFKAWKIKNKKVERNSYGSNDEMMWACK